MSGKKTSNRRQQLLEAQSRRRARLDDDGKVLLQGVVSKDVRKRYALLKVNLEMDSLGQVMTHLLQFWERHHGNK